MNAIAIPISHPTLIKTANAEDFLSFLGDFVWPSNNGPVENILRLVDFGLMFVLPFPMQVISIVGSMFGYDLQALGRYIDKELGLKKISDLASLNHQDASTKLLGGIPVDNQVSLLQEFAQTQEQQNYDRSFSTTAGEIEVSLMEKEAAASGAGKLLLHLFKNWSNKGIAKGTSSAFKAMIKTLGGKRTLATMVMGTVALVGWLIKVAYKIVTTPVKLLLRNPGKALVGAGAVGVTYSMYGKDSDPRGEDENAGEKELTGELGEFLNKTTKKILKGTPKTFRGKIEQEVDKTMMGAY